MGGREVLRIPLHRQWLPKKEMTSDEQIACALIGFWLAVTWVRCEDVIMLGLG